MRGALTQLRRRLSSLSREDEDAEVPPPIIDMRSIALRSVVEVRDGILAGTLVPDVELYKATRNLSETVRAGTSITVNHVNADGSIEGYVYCVDEIITFTPAADAVKVERKDWTTEDVAQYVIPRSVIPDKHIYICTLDEANVGAELEGTFVSQARRCRFADLVAALEKHFGEASSTAFVWLDIFCANQPLLNRRVKETPPQIVKKREAFMNNGLHRAISGFTDVVVFFDRWDEPAPLKRAWCVWEILGAIQNEKPINVAFPPGQEEDFVQQLRTEPGKIAEIMAENNDMRNAECYKEEDKVMIRSAVERTVQGGYVKLNATVNNRVREWHAQMARNAVAYARQHGSDPKDLAEILLAAGYLLHEQGEYEKALKNHQEALVIYKEVLPPRHPDIASAMNSIALAYDAKGMYKEALTYLQVALSIRKEAYGECDLRVARVLHSIASVYHSQALYSDSLAHFAQALDIKRQRLGARDIEVASTLSSIALVRIRLRQFDVAFSLNEQTLSIRKEVHGSRHFSVALTLNDMALIHRHQGHYVRALHLFKEALSIFKESLGEGHHRMATTLTNLAGVYSLCGRYDEALRLNERAVLIYCEAFGVQHTSVATALNNIAVIYVSQGRYSDALLYYKQALAINRVALSNQHPSVAATLKNIAGVYEESHHHEEALEYFQEALEIFQNVFGLEHPDVAKTLSDIALVQLRKGCPELALVSYKQALDIFEQLDANHLPEVANTLSRIAEVHQSQGCHEEALQKFKKSSDVSARVYGPRHPFVAITMARIADTLDAQGHAEDALGLLSTALEIHKEAQGGALADVASVLESMASLQKKLGQNVNALRSYRRALSVVEDVLGDKDPSVVRILSSMADVHSAQGDSVSALICYRKALLISEAFEDSESVEASILNRIGRTFDAQGLYDEALEFFYQALDVGERAYGPRHPFLVGVLNSIALVRVSQGLPHLAHGPLEQSWAIYKESPKDEREMSRLAFTLHDVAMAYALAKRYDDAACSYQKALGHFRELLGERHHWVATVLYNFGLVIFRLGDRARALDYFVEAKSIRQEVFGIEHNSTREIQDCIEACTLKSASLSVPPQILTP
ncbi:Kinesin light chain 3 [Hondaea fermentalgiana]|uniref:Kinesin light chain 3 n=1 Tax=Hondaea fermentalgiana TaxID=2315210 RepID=A0A2R5GC42_9STRA|nr:Kinesin light chain 3 [Hondaea fermentalgiana]|eukprot:GBG28125.1 Kinesin light chain 3 [Hondaea fermentalgiana]